MRIGDWSSDVCSSDLFWLVEAGENGVRQPSLDQERSSCRDESGACRYGKRRHSLRSWRAVKTPGGRLQWVDHCLSVDPQIGRASCGERVCQYVSLSVVAVVIKKKNSK